MRQTGMRASKGAWSAMRSVDVHTHVYLPRYMEVMRGRTTVPRIRVVDGQDRLLILPGEEEEGTTAAGRPIGAEYHDRSSKLRFMDRHGIEVSVLSLANPWLDFLEGDAAAPLASLLNDDMEEVCAGSDGRFYGFGVLPVRDPEAAARELDRIAHLPHMRGAILGSRGAGNGLDDPAFDAVWEAAQRNGQVLFLHPHYGVGVDQFAGFGHALFLALGFTFETTTAVARLICSGALDRFPDLKLLLAHSGGTLPFLAGRLDSCVAHDAVLAGSLKKKPSEYLQKLYFDALQYQEPSLRCVADLSGVTRMMFGTDHPFFPPAAPEEEEWVSTVQNYRILDAFAPADRDAVLRENAYRLLNIKPRE